MKRRIMAGIENAPLASRRARAVTPSKRAHLGILRVRALPKSVTRFSDKKRDQTKNRERFPIRLKRDPLWFVLGTNRKKDVTKADGLVEVPICAILTRPISVGRSFRPMTFHISLIGRKDLNGEIYRQIRRAILAGRLRAGDRLPPSRELARALAVSRMTVIVGYERLAGEGLVTSRLGVEHL